MEQTLLQKLQSKLQEIHESYWRHKKQAVFDSEVIALWRSEEYKQLTRNEKLQITLFSQQISVKTLKMEEGKEENETL